MSMHAGETKAYCPECGKITKHTAKGCTNTHATPKAKPRWGKKDDSES